MKKLTLTYLSALGCFSLPATTLDGGVRWLQQSALVGAAAGQGLRPRRVTIRAQYNSNKGSIYGVVSDGWKNLAFKAPKQSTLYPNLFFVGGSVNPGGGMPMVILCGQNVAKKVVDWDRPSWSD